MKKITYEEFKENGKRMMKIPVGEKEYAVTEATTWNEIREIGLWSKWRIGAGGHVIASHPAFPNGYTLVSRVITSATENERVHYIDKNVKNLRKSNLKLIYDQRGNLQPNRAMILGHLSSLPAKPTKAVAGHLEFVG